jgi:predicted hydrocarbon binding protein
VVHAEFRQFALERVGRPRWTSLLGEAGLPVESHRLSERYPDEELVAAVGLLARETGSAPEVVLHDFGKALFPVLAATYGDLIPRDWRTLDLVEHTERVIHRTVRLQDAAASPPRLSAVRASEDEVRVLYASSRRLCALAGGLLDGAAEHFGESVSVSEERCRRRGDPFCEFVVRVGDGSD